MANPICECCGDEYEIKDAATDCGHCTFCLQEAAEYDAWRATQEATAQRQDEAQAARPQVEAYSDDEIPY